MPWVKLDDTFPEHPKILAVGGNAAWLHVCAIAYANRNLTDGHIPANVLVRLSDRPRPRALAERLVAAGLWELNGDGWQIHDFLEYQTSKARVEEERAKARDRMAKARGYHPDSSPDVRPNNQRSATNPTQTETETENDNDVARNESSSSSSVDRQTTRKEIAAATARLLANKRKDLTNRNGWIRRTTKGLLEERLADIDRCIDNGYTTETAAELLAAVPVEAATPVKEAWYQDPDCDDCGGEGWVTDDNGFMVECSCRQDEPYPTRPKLGLVR